MAISKRAWHVPACFVVIPRHLDALECWTKGFTYEACCAATSQESEGCWSPEAGATRETCCSSKQDEEPLIERSTQFFHGVWKWLLELENQSNCERSGAILFAALEQEFHGQDVLALKDWWTSRSDDAKVKLSKECLDPNKRRLLQLTALESVLASVSESEPQSSAMNYYFLLADAFQASIERKNQAVWAAATRKSEQDRGVPWAIRTPVHIAMVASVGKPPFGKKAMAGIRSALFFAQTRPVVFHLFVDDEGEIDMLSAIEDMESWLKARGTFRLYPMRSIGHVLDAIRATIPPDCLAYNPHYGTPGWLRLYAPDLITDPMVKVIAWVDAGDYVFLSDPAKLLSYHKRFSSNHIMGAPYGHPLPFQLFDLERMRKANWSKLVVKVVRAGYQEEREGLCRFGEGRAFNRLADGYEHLWFWFHTTWAYEPWSDWFPGFGVNDVWSGRGPAYKTVWQKRMFPGLLDYTKVHVHCLGFQESLINHILASGASSVEVKAGISISTHLTALSEHNYTYIDAKGQYLTCNEKVLGMHFVMPFHFVPWVHRFLNFWSGSHVWREDWDKGRDLRI